MMSENFLLHFVEKLFEIAILTSFCHRWQTCGDFCGTLFLARFYSETNELRTLEFSSLLHSLGRSDSSLLALDVGELGFVRAAQVTGRPVGSL